MSYIICILVMVLTQILLGFIGWTIHNHLEEIKNKLMELESSYKNGCMNSGGEE